MIDHEARRIAAQLTRQFRDGLLTNDDLQNNWPLRSADRALGAIESMLWRYYDDHRVHTLSDLSPEAAEDLSRYAAFLDTDLPYEWSVDRFDRIDWLRMADKITFGLIPSIAERMRERDANVFSEGDATVWPFIRATDAATPKVR